ncbi:hypothetical protein V757_01065 [Pelistega indica]|uniref:DUF2213 domain-containing protein n=1 Tax=Pelistega indica TaxID=1414851 RepID=V8GB70_9BURK|nr:DUF2213 domain-containing protein [Pelistega indica]ETD72963.1 hypothetical protein V757_01065 [Pelistega indica]
MRFNDKANSSISQRKMTRDGYLVVPASISRIGVFDYLDTELSVGTKEEIKKVARTERSLFSDETIKSFDGAPITIGHPSGSVRAENWKQLSVGNIRNVKREGDVLTAEAWIYDADAIKLVQDGQLEELSCGYDCDLLDSTDPCADFEMSPMLGNHVAIVAKGRCGGSVKLADKEINMSKSVNFLDTLLGAFGIKLSDEQKQKVEEEEKKEAGVPSDEGKPEDGTPEEKKSDDKPEDDPESDEEKKKPVKDADMASEIAALRKQLADEKAERHAEKLRSAVLADAQSSFPTIKIVDSDNARSIREKAIIESGLYETQALKTLSDEAVTAVYEVAKKHSVKDVNAGVGKAIVTDSKPEANTMIDFNSLYNIKESK